MGNRSYNVEVFHNGKFHGWFPCETTSELFSTISRLDGTEKISDLKLSYLIFRKGKHGRWVLYKGGPRYYLSSCLNTTGKEKSEFFKLAT